MSSSDGLKREVLPDEEFNGSAVTHTLLAAILEWIMRLTSSPSLIDQIPVYERCGHRKRLVEIDSSAHPRHRPPAKHMVLLNEKGDLPCESARLFSS
jgi:hypothetical protein